MLKAQSTLLYGPEGCGKTKLANAILNGAKENEYSTVVELKKEELLDDPKRLENVFKTIKRFAIRALLIDDVDDLLPLLKRHGNAYALLMRQLKRNDGGLTIVATARLPERLSKEERGAFRNVIPRLYPDFEERMRMLGRLASVAEHEGVKKLKGEIDLSASESHVRIEDVAHKTEWWSHAELDRLIDDSTEFQAISADLPFLTQLVFSEKALSANVRAIGQNIIPERRVERMKELLRFTAAHCTDADIRSDVLTRFGGLLKKGHEESHLITILFLSADPTNASRLRLGEEAREIQGMLRLAKLRDRIVVQQRTSVRANDLSQSLLDVGPQIVHFSGHGTAAGELCIEDKVGRLQPVHPDALSLLFEQFKETVQCVVLNACYSSIQAEAIAKHIGYVVGMRWEIGDAAAIAFATGFYQAIGAGQGIRKAYKLGCIQISLQGIPEHLTPELYEGGKKI